MLIIKKLKEPEFYNISNHKKLKESEFHAKI